VRGQGSLEETWQATFGPWATGLEPMLYSNYWVVFKLNPNK